MNQRKTYHRFSGIVFSVFCLGLLMRPSIFQAFGEIIFAGFSGLIAVYFLLGLPGYVSRRSLVFFASVFLFCSYVTLQGTLFGSQSPGPLLTSAAFVFVPGLVVFLLSPQNWSSGLKAIIYTVGLFIPTYVISTILLLAGNDLEAIRLLEFNVPMGDKAYTMVLAFPYSPYFYNIAYIGEIALPRANGILREPGLFQVLAITTFFGVDFTDIKQKLFFKVGSVLLLFTTFSTAGFGSFVACWAYYFVFAKRGVGGRSDTSSLKTWLLRIGAILALAVIVYFAVFFDSKFSLMGKLESGSGTVRVIALLQAFDVLLQNPVFGIGYGNTQVDPVIFIGVMAQIGFVGVFLAFMMSVAPNLDLITRRHPVLVLLIPVLLTTLFSQPLFDKPLFVLIVALVAAYPYRDVTQDPNFVDRPSRALEHA